MDGVDFYKVKAIHPHWRGFLRLSTVDNTVVHDSHRSKGTYDLSNGTLAISWERFKPDVFQMCSGVYIHEAILKEIPRLDGLFGVRVGEKTVIAKRISVSVPDENYDVSLRLGTSDVPTYHQIFVRDEYDSPNLPASAKTIVDLGANIGLATVFFGLKYPDAEILSVEPEADNFGLMVANTAALGDRVQKRHAAVWSRNGFVNLHTESEDGSSLGAWGVQVSDRMGPEEKLTRGCTLGSLLDDAEFAVVDILKVDIEGAELEVFSQAAAEWLSRVNLIIVETHDRFRPGSDSAVRKAIQPAFEELPSLGENLFFRRKSR